MSGEVHSIEAIVEGIVFWTHNRNDLTAAGKATLLDMVGQLPAAHSQAVAKAVEEKDGQIAWEREENSRLLKLMGDMAILDENIKELAVRDAVEKEQEKRTCLCGQWTIHADGRSIKCVPPVGGESCEGVFVREEEVKGARRDAMEECAKIAESMESDDMYNMKSGCDIAAAIRAKMTE